MTKQGNVNLINMVSKHSVHLGRFRYYIEENGFTRCLSIGCLMLTGYLASMFLKVICPCKHVCMRSSQFMIYSIFVIKNLPLYNVCTDHKGI